MTSFQPYSIVHPSEFESENHWYAKALNATIHPLIAYFLKLDKERLVERYCHLHPVVEKNFLLSLLETNPRYFRWAGADLINVTTAGGKKQMVIIENNSCPSGQKSMPLLDDHDDLGGYRLLIESTFLPTISRRPKIHDGALAVLYDKNPMEASGYAATLAELTGEDVFYIYFPKEEYQSYLRFQEGILQLKTDNEQWINIRAAFRYVTQKPWNRIPIHTKTRILNPVLACLAGGRNKMVAAKAYDIYNAELEGTGLSIYTPETIWDVEKSEVPIWVRKLGGQAVIKVPYSNAGQGVFTIVNNRELDEFMKKKFEYDKFIVQSLIGNYRWSSVSSKGKLYHVGTVPSKRGFTYVYDLRMMINATEHGIKPLCIYSRRARQPLMDDIHDSSDSWSILGTNLSVAQSDGLWSTDTNRLLLMDRRDYNKLGLGLDDLIEAFIQSVLSMLAIDRMAQTLINSKGQFRRKLFESLNNDQGLLDEILQL
jgi:hypothetical protein